LNGTYDLQVGGESSTDCPANISIYHFGTQMGVGWGPADLRLVRLADSSVDGDPGSGCVHFATVCGGVQFHMDLAVAGKFEKRGDHFGLRMHLVRTNADSRVVTVDRCTFVSRARAQSLFEAIVDQRGAVVGLAVAFALTLLFSCCVTFLCLSYRRRYILAKYSPDRHSFYAQHM